MHVTTTDFFKGQETQKQEAFVFKRECLEESKGGRKDLTL